VPPYIRDVHTHSLQTDILGPVRVFSFSSSKEGEGDAVAIISGDPESTSNATHPPLLRMHSRCLYGELFLSRDCDCYAQYKEALRLILDERSGILCYLEQEGRGQGLVDKAKAYEYMEEQGVDTVEAYRELNYSVDGRGYGHVAAFLRGLGVYKVRLITNNPRKVVALEKAGVTVERVPVVVGINHWNAHYMAAKRNKLGHFIDVPLQGDDSSAR
jgi:GTP cyclohydrolase II